MTWLYVVLAILAAWRLAHDFTTEYGPFGIFFRARRFVQAWTEALIDVSDVEDVKDHWAYFLYSGIACPHCLSFWTALAVALLWVLPGARWVVLWLGVAGAASLVNKAVSKWLM